MKRILIALFFSAVSLAQAGEATIQFRVFGLFDPPRVDELKSQASSIADFRIAEVNYETGVVTFAYANDKPPFQHSKPENMERGIRERLQPATRGNFQIKPLSTFPREKWMEVKIGIVGLDCRGCSYAAHNAIVEMEGVERVTASFHDGFVTAWIDPSKTNKEALAAMLKKREIKVAEEAEPQSAAVSSEKGAVDLYAEDAWKQEGIAGASRRFELVTEVAHPKVEGLSVYLCESRKQWWGRALVVKHRGDQVDWMAAEPVELVEQRGNYVLSARWRELGELGWVLEVFDRSHMGNGSVWLFALEGQSLRTLMHTRAVDQHHEARWSTEAKQEVSVIYQGGRLGLTYLRGAVRLEGIAETLNEQGQILSTSPVAETWNWDSTQRIFVLARK